MTTPGFGPTCAAISSFHRLHCLTKPFPSLGHVPRSWNVLPPDIKLISTRTSFRKKIKTHFLVSSSLNFYYFFSMLLLVFLCTCMYCTAPLSPRKGRLRSFTMVMMMMMMKAVNKILFTALHSPVLSCRAFRVQRTCLKISRNPKIKANMVVSECTVCVTV